MTFATKEQPGKSRSAAACSSDNFGLPLGGWNGRPPPPLSSSKQSRCCEGAVIGPPFKGGGIGLIWSPGRTSVACTTQTCWRGAEPREEEELTDVNGAFPTKHVCRRCPEESGCRRSSWCHSLSNVHTKHATLDGLSANSVQTGRQLRDTVACPQLDEAWRRRANAGLKSANTEGRREQSFSPGCPDGWIRAGKCSK